MSDSRPKILIIVEGAKTDVRLMEKLLTIYEFAERYEIVSYNTNIYTLYQELFAENDPAVFDLLQLLKEHEPDEQKKKLFDEVYSDILLIFDLDPQDPAYTPEKIKRMAQYFVESSDMGKLYLNYPMVEAFYHMGSIPDPQFDTYCATLQELCDGTYKQRVNRENRNHDYRKFAVTRYEMSAVIRQNLAKARRLSNMPQNEIPSQSDVFKVQSQIMALEKRVAVLCTCIFFIPEYNAGLIEEPAGGIT